MSAENSITTTAPQRSQRLQPRDAMRRFPPAVADGLAAVSAVALFGAGRSRDDARAALREVARLVGETLALARQIRRTEQERRVGPKRGARGGRP